MHEEPEMREGLAVHIRAAARPLGETDRLAAAISDACWPGGVADRSEPVARGWLRMWGPARLVVDVPVCGCARGHCAICN
jgi:hypothetical protein